MKQQKNNRQLIVICHNIRSAHNIGSIFRTADAAGVSRIILGGYSAHPPNPKISKTALGAENIVPYERIWHTHKIIETLKKEGFLIAALEKIDDSFLKPRDPRSVIPARFAEATACLAARRARRAKAGIQTNTIRPGFRLKGRNDKKESTVKNTNLFNFRPRFPLALILGNEVRGLSKEILRRSDEIIYIPMLGKKESLNVSVAFGIAVYQLRISPLLS